MSLIPCQPTLGARRNASGLLLGDGRVLLVGGATAGGLEASMLASCELYDPLSDRWRVAPRLQVPRQELALLTLADGGVLALGGRLHDRTPLGVIEMWHADQPAWARLPDLPTPVWGARAVVVDADRALLVGGFAPSGPTNTAWWIDRHTAALWPAPATRFPHANHAIGLSPEGSPLVAGPRIERLDGERWRELGGLVGGDADASAMVRIVGGRVLLAGGRAVEDAESALSDTGLLVANAYALQDLPPIGSDGRWGHTLARFGADVVAVGGLTDHRQPRYVDTWEVWSEPSGWRPLHFAERRWLHVQVELSDGSTLLIGGADDRDGRPGAEASQRVSRLVAPTSTAS